MEKMIIIVGEEIPEEIKENTSFSIYEFPEIKLHPKKQIEWFNNKLNEFLKCPNVIIIKTYSDYIIREINYYIMKNIIDYKSVYIIDNNIMGKCDEEGIEAISIDNVITEQNERVENAYYDLRYGEEE